MAVEWFRPGKPLDPERAASLWLVMTERERERFRALARVGVEEFRATAAGERLHPSE